MFLFDARTQSVAEWVELWMEHHVAIHCRSRTVTTYRSSLRQLPPDLMAMNLADVDPYTAQSMVDRDAREKGWRVATLRIRYATLRSAFQRAVDWDIIDRNPWQKIRYPKAERSRARALSIAEMDAVEHSILSMHPRRDLRGRIPMEVWYGYALLIASRTGLRYGELVALRPDAVDMNHLRGDGELGAMVNVVRQADGRQGRVPRFRKPKSQSAVREIELGPTARGWLVAQAEMVARRKRQHDPRRWSEYGLLFPTSLGSLPHGLVINRALQRHCALAGVDRCTLHDLRHTYATRLIEAGIGFEIVKHAMGHQYYSTTVDMYSHVTAECRTTVADVLESARGGSDYGSRDGALAPNVRRGIGG